MAIFQEIAIEAKNLSKIYHLYNKPIDRLKEALHPFRKSYHNDFAALEDISFEVRRGETVGIIGRNGAGKSTLLKILTGVLTQTRGSYRVNGKISSLLELGTGFNPELTGLENVYFNGMLLNISKEEIDRKINSIIQFADIGEFIKRPVKIYSSGMFARLAFAVAFHIDPDILIVDEALSVGDLSFQKKCFDKFNEIRSRGVTILLVSHDPYQVKGYCQRAIYLKNGKCEIFGHSADVVDAYTYDQQKLISAGSENIAYLDSSDSSVQAPLPQNSNNALIEITQVHLLNSHNQPIGEVTTGQTVIFRFYYAIHGKFEGRLSFVFNLYRHDDFYVCGATSVMDKLPSFEARQKGVVSVTFENFSLLSGRYKWRAAVNDASGLGIYTEATPVCEFQVKDNFESVGMAHLQRTWSVE